MTSIRRIVVSDEETNRPIIVSEMLREVMNIALAPENGFYPPSERYSAPHDNYRLIPITVPPDTLTLSPMDTYTPGFYGWESVDILHVDSGELILNLIDGRAVRLRAGDMFLLNGLLQSCRNPGSLPVHAVAVTIYPD